MTQTDTTALGNTKTKSVANNDKKVENKGKKCRKWCFTLNNWTEKEYLTLLTQLTQHKYIVGKEIGEKGTPHLQGYIECKNAIRFETLKKWNDRLHIEKCKGDRKSNLVYCSKDKDYETNFNMSEIIDKKMYVLEQEYKNVVWKPYQDDILKLLGDKPDSRKINWYWEENGNVGKSFLCKYIALKYDNVIISEGKKDNVYNQILSLYNSENYIIEKPIICILDISRHNQDYINYGCLESIKNGMIYSGKYEGGQCYFTTPHIVVFSNEEPDYSKWSSDRYNVVNIDNKTECEFEESDIEEQ